MRRMKFFWGEVDQIHSIGIKVSLLYHPDRNIMSLAYKAFSCFSETQRTSLPGTHQNVSSSSFFCHSYIIIIVLDTFS